MGGGNSILNVTDIVNKTATNIATSIMQSTDNVVRNDQSIDLDCTSFLQAIAPAYLECVTIANDSGFDAADILLICEPIVKGNFECTVDGVTMKSVINTGISADSQAEVGVDISTAIDQNFKTDLSQDLDGLQFDNDVSNYLSVFTEITSNAYAASTSDMYAEVGSNQCINIDGGSVKFTTIESSIDAQLDILSRTKGWIGARTNLVSAIDTQISQKSGIGDGLTSTIFMWVGIILAGLVILALLIWLFRWLSTKRKKRKSGSDQPNVKFKLEVGGDDLPK
jgi:hypothetical protein